MTSIYLRPFQEDLEHNQYAHGTEADLSVLHSLFDVLLLVHSTLRHVVLNVHTSAEEGYGRPHSHIIKLGLRSALLRLQSLESYCSIRDESYLLCGSGATISQVDIPPVWQDWNMLQVVALAECYMTNQWFWSKIARLPLLHTVILLKPIDAHEYNLKSIWRIACEGAGVGERSLNVYILMERSMNSAALRQKLAFRGEGWHHEKVKVRIIHDIDSDLTHGMLSAHRFEEWDRMPEAHEVFE